jgi:hypothetical protein
MNLSVTACLSVHLRGLSGGRRKHGHYEGGGHGNSLFIDQKIEKTYRNTRPFGNQNDDFSVLMNPDVLNRAMESPQTRSLRGLPRKLRRVLGANKTGTSIVENIICSLH